KAAGEKRYSRKNDFRASGSGDFDYKNIELSAVALAFKTASQLKLQSVAFDFIFDEKKRPLIVEMSYGFGTKGISNVPGYWDKDLNWHKGKFYPQEWIIEDLLQNIEVL